MKTKWRLSMRRSKSRESSYDAGRQSTCRTAASYEDDKQVQGAFTETADLSSTSYSQTPHVRWSLSEISRQSFDHLSAKSRWKYRDREAYFWEPGLTPISSTAKDKAAAVEFLMEITDGVPVPAPWVVESAAPYPKSQSTPGKRVRALFANLEQEDHSYEHPLQAEFKNLLKIWQMCLDLTGEHRHFFLEMLAEKWDAETKAEEAQWEKVLDAEGQVYYWDVNTGRTTYCTPWEAVMPRHFLRTQALRFFSQGKDADEDSSATEASATVTIRGEASKSSSQQIIDDAEAPALREDGQATSDELSTWRQTSTEAEVPSSKMRDEQRQPNQSSQDPVESPVHEVPEGEASVAGEVTPGVNATVEANAEAKAANVEVRAELEKSRSGGDNDDGACSAPGETPVLETGGVHSHESPATATDTTTAAAATAALAQAPDTAPAEAEAAGAAAAAETAAAAAGKNRVFYGNCNRGHPLVLIETKPGDTGWHDCDGCGQQQIRHPENVYRCSECDYDLCGQCCFAMLPDMEDVARDAFPQQHHQRQTPTQQPPSKARTRPPPPQQEGPQQQQHQHQRQRLEQHHSQRRSGQNPSPQPSPPPRRPRPISAPSMTTGARGAQPAQLDPAWEGVVERIRRAVSEATVNKPSGSSSNGFSNSSNTNSNSSNNSSGNDSKHTTVVVVVAPPAIGGTTPDVTGGEVYGFDEGSLVEEDEEATPKGRMHRLSKEQEEQLWGRPQNLQQQPRARPTTAPPLRSSSAGAIGPSHQIRGAAHVGGGAFAVGQRPAALGVGATRCGAAEVWQGSTGRHLSSSSTRRRPFSATTYSSQNLRRAVPRTPPAIPPFPTTWQSRNQRQARSGQAGTPGAGAGGGGGGGGGGAAATTTAATTTAATTTAATETTGVAGQHRLPPPPLPPLHQEGEATETNSTTPSFSGSDNRFGQRSFGPTGPPERSASAVLQPPFQQSRSREQWPTVRVAFEWRPPPGVVRSRPSSAASAPGGTIRVSRSGWQEAWNEMEEGGTEA